MFIENSEVCAYYLKGKCASAVKRFRTSDRSYIIEQIAVKHLLEHPEKFTLKDLAHACRKRNESDSRPLVTVTHEARLLIRSSVIGDIQSIWTACEINSRACLRCAVEEPQLTSYDLYFKLYPENDPEKQLYCNRGGTMKSLPGRFALHFIHGKLAMEWADKLSGKNGTAAVRLKAE